MGRILKYVTLVLVSLMLVGCSKPKKVDPYEGIKAYGVGNFETAIKIFDQGCKGGDQFMCFSLGKVYEEGLMTKEDRAKARTLYSQSCEAGFIEACYRLAAFYKDGIGARQNYAQALRLYYQACIKGLAQACYDAGVMYYNKQGVKEDKPATKELFGKACDLGHQKSCDIYRKLTESGY